VADLDAEFAGKQGLSRSVAIWMGSNGVYMSDGRTPIRISDDIRNIWNKRESSPINTAVADKATAFWDQSNLEYHLNIPTGSSTTMNEEWVFSFIKMAWFQIDRGSGKYLQYGVEVKDTSGIDYTYGFIDTGYCERLENGNDFDGTAITHTAQFGDIPLHKQISTETYAKYHGLIAVAKTSTSNNLTITHYPDGSTTGTSWTHSSNKSNYRLLEWVKHDSLGPAIFHSWKIVISTDDETSGFEPLYFYVLYNISGDGIRKKDRR
jgi:hypothetical protein